MEWVTKGWNKVCWHTKRVNFDNEHLQQTERSNNSAHERILELMGVHKWEYDLTAAGKVKKQRLHFG
jgi:hypothetical protein